MENIALTQSFVLREMNKKSIKISFIISLFQIRALI